jgi:YD repeat-containing protein
MELDNFKGDIKRCKEIQDNVLISEAFFDNESRIIEEKQFMNYSQTYYHTTKTYLPNECITKRVQYDKEHHKIGTSEITTNDHEDIIRHIKKDSNDDIIFDYKFGFKRNNKGQIIERSGPTNSYKFDYDSKGNLLRKRKYEDNTLTKTQISVFDKHNNEISWKKYNKEGILTKFECCKYENNKIVEKLCFIRDDYQIYKRCPINSKQTSEALARFWETLKPMKALQFDIDGNELDFPLNICYFDCIITYKYDDNDNLISVIERSYRPDFSETYFTEKIVEAYHYDINNKLVKKCVTDVKTDWDDYWEEDHTDIDNESPEEKKYDKKGNIIYLNDLSLEQETYYQYEYYDGYKSDGLPRRKHYDNFFSQTKQSNNNKIWSKLKRLWS